MKPDYGKCLSPPFAVRPRRGLVLRTSRRGGSRKKFAEKVVINICNKCFLGASRHTYGDVPRLLARRRDGGPGIRLARVVASRARAAFPGSRRGDGNTGVSGASLTGCSFFVVRGSPAEPQPVPLGGGAGLQRSTQSTQGSPIWGIRGLGTRITIVVTGPGTPLFPPPRNGGPAFFLPSKGSKKFATPRYPLAKGKIPHVRDAHALPAPLPLLT
jgi:hypothetical protein